LLCIGSPIVLFFYYIYPSAQVSPENDIVHKRSIIIDKIENVRWRTYNSLKKYKIGNLDSDNNINTNIHDENKSSSSTSDVSTSDVSTTDSYVSDINTSDLSISDINTSDLSISDIESISDSDNDSDSESISYYPFSNCKINTDLSDINTSIYTDITIVPFTNKIHKHI